jgi:ADP-ribosyl-[dinitrogen reductase] hydrolase
MLGNVIGYIIGSVYEFNNHRSKNFDLLFHRQAQSTDDTV